MADDDKVQIRFTDRNFISKYGVQPIVVSPSVAKMYEEKGWARIITTLPNANPALPPKENKITDEKKNTMPEDSLISKAGWITSISYIDTTLRKVGDRLGYTSIVFFPDSLSIGSLMMSDIVILGYDLSKFTPLQSQQIKAVIFQKNIPYVLRIDERLTDIPWLVQCSLHSKGIIFPTEEVFDEVLDILGEALDEIPWFIESAGNYYRFWHFIEELLGKTK